MSNEELRTFIKYPFPLISEGAVTISATSDGLAKAELCVGGVILSVLEFSEPLTSTCELNFLGDNIPFHCALADDACVNIYIDSACEKVPSITLAEEPITHCRGQMFTQEVTPRNSAGEVLSKTLAYIDGRVGFIRR